ncbi:MAG: cytochrome c4 [Gammaproteobacteria bacterium]|nr:cytochrome c4 [Gammaproteobacteria bacterium]
MKPSHIGAIIIGLSSVFSFTLFAADSEAGKTKSALCAGCHGVDGNSTNGVWPKLAGQHASYLEKQIHEFKNGTRADPVMMGMVAALSDTDIEDIAAYYESQSIKSGAFDQALLEKGEAIYRGGITETSVPACIACHGPAGEGNGPALFPLLKSQHPEYTVAQLNKFKDGSRSNDPGKMMANVSVRMLDSEMAAVAAYLAALQ